MDGDSGHILTQKVGPLPLVVWVMGGAGVVFLFLLMKGQSSANNAQNNTTNQVSALAPTEAEAFGTIEQQQQDVTNALSTLGNNQSALGGSLSTLTGIVTQQGADNAAAFQNLQDGQNTIQQGQASAASASANYYQSLLTNLTNYANSLGSQINGVNTNVSAQGAANQNLLTQLQQAIAGVSGQVSGVAGQQQATNQDLANVQAGITALQNGQQLTTSQLNSIGTFLGWQWYQLPNRYTPMLPGNGSLNTSTMF